MATRRVSKNLQQGRASTSRGGIHKLFYGTRAGIHQLFYGTWVADFMLRQDAGRFMLGKYLSDLNIPWKQRRRLGMAVAGNTPTASLFTKIGMIQSAGCRLCRIAREASTDGLAAETHGHINTASSTTVTAVHHSIWTRRHLYDSMHAAQKPKSKLYFVTLDKETSEKYMSKCMTFSLL